jgi:hypothetical protein
VFQRGTSSAPWPTGNIPVEGVGCCHGGRGGRCGAPVQCFSQSILILLSGISSISRSSQYCDHHTTQYVRLFLPEYNTVYDTSSEVVSPRREKSGISKIS